jgi:hypothetical protein
MLCPDIKAFTLTWSVSEGLVGAWVFFTVFTFPRGCILEVGSLSAEGCWSTGSLCDACWSIKTLITKQPASPWTWLGLTSPNTRHRADQTGEHAFMSLVYQRSCPKHLFFFPAQTCLPSDREGRREIDVRVLGCDAATGAGKHGS